MSCSKLRGWSAGCLVGEDKKGDLLLSDTMLTKLSQMQGRAVIIAGLGNLRTGKSTLLNMLSDSIHSDGFPMSDAIDPETKGIWVHVVEHPHKRDLKIIFLDTEGLDSTDQHDKDYDNKIAIIATMISHVLLYNIRGVLNHTSLASLGFLSKIMESLGRTVGAVDAPLLVTLLRDCDLVCRQGADVYMQTELLKLTHGRVDEADRQTVRAFKEFFRETKAFIIPHPGKRALHECKEGELAIDFVRTTKELKAFLLDYTKNITHDKTTTFPVFVEFLRKYVRAVREGHIPHQSDVYAAVFREENEQQLKAALSLYTRGMQEQLAFPVEQLTHLHTLHQTLSQQAHHTLTTAALGDTQLKQEYKAKLQACLDKEHHDLEARHCTESERKCNAKLQQMKPQSWDPYVADLNIFNNSSWAWRGDFLTANGLGFKRQEIWDKYLTSAQRQVTRGAKVRAYQKHAAFLTMRNESLMAMTVLVDARITTNRGIEDHGVVNSATEAIPDGLATVPVLLGSGSDEALRIATEEACRCAPEMVKSVDSEIVKESVKATVKAISTDAVKKAAPEAAKVGLEVCEGAATAAPEIAESGSGLLGAVTSTAMLTTAAAAGLLIGVKMTYSYYKSSQELARLEEDFRAKADTARGKLASDRQALQALDNYLEQMKLLPRYANSLVDVDSTGFPGQDEDLNTVSETRLRQMKDALFLANTSNTNAVHQFLES